MSKDGLGKDVVYEYQTALRGLIPYKKESSILLLSFWNLDKEVSDAILENKGSFKFEEREMPDEDFRKSFYEIVPEEYMGLIITQKDGLLKSQSFFLYTKHHIYYCLYDGLRG